MPTSVGVAVRFVRFGTLPVAGDLLPPQTSRRFVSVIPAYRARCMLRTRAVGFAPHLRGFHAEFDSEAGVRAQSQSAVWLQPVAQSHGRRICPQRESLGLCAACPISSFDPISVSHNATRPRVCYAEHLV